MKFVYRSRKPPKKTLGGSINDKLDFLRPRPHARQHGRTMPHGLPSGILQGNVPFLVRAEIEGNSFIHATRPNPTFISICPCFRLLGACHPRVGNSDGYYLPSGVFGALPSVMQAALRVIGANLRAFSRSVKPRPNSVAPATAEYISYTVIYRPSSRTGLPFWEVTDISVCIPQAIPTLHFSCGLVTAIGCIRYSL